MGPVEATLAYSFPRDRDLSMVMIRLSLGHYDRRKNAEKTGETQLTTRRVGYLEIDTLVAQGCR